MEVFVFGWRIIVGSVIGFFGGALGSIGGGGGGGIFIPMLIFIIGFDHESSAPISKCMVAGAAVATVYYNFKRRHPTLEMPVMDYNLALLLQPMLMLGISMGVSLRLVFPDWIVTILLVIFVLGTVGEESGNKPISSSSSCDTSMKTNSVSLHANERIGNHAVDQKSIPSFPSNGSLKNITHLNVYWNELVILVFIWVAFLLLQIAKNETTTCSMSYWILSTMQIPVSVGGSLYQADSLYKGKKVIGSMGIAGMEWKKHQLIIYCLTGLLSGMVV
ncbi:hypothetical protein MKX03_032980 [Papaver bracteatum]|nr:hypothetical protein MKX03_032980 [Papaver bracteatum]